ncbi:hypothetical protein GCM10022222_84430 [Amycolatopsis ultiminotia]|uniref:DUF4192 domain-containing protein n=1 Tax=Amycolatopsis ultiminotia TaxID=543629 RepID=A0ABP6YPX5_9PSEU
MSTPWSIGEVIAALPNTGHDTLYVIACHDNGAPQEIPAVLAAFPTTCLSRDTGSLATALQAHFDRGTTHLILIVIGRQVQKRDLPHRAALAALGEALLDLGGHVVGTIWAPRAQPGVSWRDYRSYAHTGRVTTPRSTIDLTKPVRVRTGATNIQWNRPFERHGDTVGAPIGWFARQMLHFAVRHDQEAQSLVTVAVRGASSGELPSDQTGYAIATALERDAIFARFLLPDPRLDARRVEQLWIALFRGTTSRKAQARLATLVAASALLRSDRTLAARSLNYADHSHTTELIVTLLHNRTTSDVIRALLSGECNALLRRS